MEDPKPFVIFPYCHMQAAEDKVNRVKFNCSWLQIKAFKSSFKAKPETRQETAKAPPEVVRSK
ncbi:hypothetical protein NPIL_332301, partial [Nephila pilipes]